MQEKYEYRSLADMHVGDSIRRLGGDYKVLKVETVKGQVRLTLEGSGRFQNKPDIEIVTRKRNVN